MNLAKFNPSFLATGLSVALLSVVTGATVTACASTSAAPQAQNMQKRHPANTKHFEQRLQAMQANAQAAANASISASQAVALVQKQAANTRIVGVHYHDSSNRPNPNPARITNNANDNIVGYRVMTLNANGQPQLYIVNASNGQVSQATMPSRPSRPSRPARPQQPNNPNSLNNIGFIQILFCQIEEALGINTFLHAFQVFMFEVICQLSATSGIIVCSFRGRWKVDIHTITHLSS